MENRSYRPYLLAGLLVILAFNNSEGLALGLVMQDIKADLHASDTQLGLLSGIAFMLFYAVMGVPLARWADRGNRVAIISITATAWSILVALCGFAASFVQLLITRIGVAIGEAGSTPAAYSLIADYFSREERPRAVAIYLLGGNLSFFIGYFLAGWIDELYGWRATFIALGSVGLLPAIVARFTLREPRIAPKDSKTIGAAGMISSAHATESTSSPPPKLTDVLITLISNVTFRHLLFSFSIAAFFCSGILQWLPTFFIRSHGLNTGRLGMWFGVMWTCGGLLGTWAGGELASRYAAGNERLQLKAMAAAYCVFAVCSAIVYLAADYHLAFGALMLAITGLAMTNGPLLATIQTLTPAPMRATGIAIVYLCSNLIGTGLGPLAVGALSDALRPWCGEESLRWALLAMAPGYFWGGWHLWRASRTVLQDVESAQRNDRTRTERAAVSTARTCAKGAAIP